MVRGFGVSAAAMFAEPTITEIEKVICLIHRNTSQKSENRNQIYPQITPITQIR